jgi:hypothetical protein
VGQRARTTPAGDVHTPVCSPAPNVAPTCRRSRPQQLGAPHPDGPRRVESRCGAVDTLLVASLQRRLP